MPDDIPMRIQESFPVTAINEQTSVQPAHLSSFGKTQQQVSSTFKPETNTQIKFSHVAQQAQLPFGSQSQQTLSSQNLFDAEKQQDQNQSQSQSQRQPTLQEMEKEAAKLRELNAQLDEIVDLPKSEIDPQRSEADIKSVYVGNVDYGSTPLELQQHFSDSGVIERITIMTNKQTGESKGFAYIEFSSTDGANKAVALLDGSVFRDRELKVSLKRTNIPGVTGGVRGGFRGRGRGRGRGGMIIRGRGRGGFRGRGGNRGAPRFSPY